MTPLSIHRKSNRPTVTGIRLLIGYLGMFLVLIGAIILLPLLMLFIFPDEWRCFLSFLVPGVGAILIGVLMYFLCIFRAEKGKLGKHQDIILLVLLWVMALIVSAFPFFLNQYFVPGATSYSYAEGIFESTSGFTTTGLTIFQDYLDAPTLSEKGIADVAEWLSLNSPHIFIFYRSVCHFFGGVGLVLVASSAISDAQGMKLYSAEGHTDKLLPNLKRSARLILTIYAGYIVAGAVGLWLFGMDWFDALQHSVAALATGGLSSRSTSLYYFLNPENIENFQTMYQGMSSGTPLSQLSGFNGIMPINPIGMEVTALILMFLGATSFMLHVELFTLKWKQFFRDIEVRLVIAVTIIFVPMMMLGAWGHQATVGIQNGNGFWYYFRASIFQFTACITTTGFANVPNINDLGPAVLFLSVIAMTIGGGMGSTAGGLKQYRVGIYLKEIHWQFKYHNTNSHFVLPKPIYRFGDLRQLGEGESKNALLYGFLYLIVVFLGATLIAFLPNITFDESIYEAASAISSAGNSMVNFSFGSLSYKMTNPMWAYQILLSVCILWMFFGRLEIIPILNAIAGSVRRIAGKDLDH